MAHDSHNLKVMFMYAIIVFVFLLIVGIFSKSEGIVGLAFTALIWYGLYAVFGYIKGRNESKKIHRKVSRANDEHIIKIVECFIRFRNPRLSKKLERKVMKDIRDGNYTIRKTRLCDKTIEYDHTYSDSPALYYWIFDDDKNVWYNVYPSTYSNAKVGDYLYIVNTPTITMKVIKSGDDYHNLLYSTVERKN